MKTKIFFIAFAASLLILSGCSKKDKNAFSWTNQFKTFDNYIGQDSAAVAQQIINDGYTFVDDEDGQAIFGKVDSETDTKYVLGFALSASKKVNAIEFMVMGMKATEDVTSTDAFVDLVNTIGAQYTSAYSTVYNFSKCSYENAQGVFNETDFAKLQINLAAIANYTPHIVWKGANESEIEIERDLEDGFSMDLTIADGNVK